MLMSVDCSTVTSLKVHLVFDDGRVKDNIIAIGDIIDVEYNRDGCRRSIEGKVLKICALGTDPKNWYILVDGSEDLCACQARFSPMNILDLDILKKGDSIRNIETPIDGSGIKGLRIVKGVLQYTTDGFEWTDIQIDDKNVINKPVQEEKDSPSCECEDCKKKVE